MKTDKYRAIIIGFIVDGNSRRDILEWLAAEVPKVDGAKAFDAACEDIRSQARATAKSDPSFVVVALKELYRRAVEVGDHKVAASILGQLDKALRG